MLKRSPLLSVDLAVFLRESGCGLVDPVRLLKPSSERARKGALNGLASAQTIAQASCRDRTL